MLRIQLLFIAIALNVRMQVCSSFISKLPPSAPAVALYDETTFVLHMRYRQNYGTPEGTFLFQYLPEKKSKQKESERKSKQ